MARQCEHLGGKRDRDDEKFTISIYTHIEKTTGFCRGARNFQLGVFARLGVIEEPTDEAWKQRCRKVGLLK